MPVTIDNNKWTETHEAAMRLRRIERQTTQLCEEIEMQIGGNLDGHYICGEPSTKEQNNALLSVLIRLRSILA